MSTNQSRNLKFKLTASSMGLNLRHSAAVENQNVNNNNNNNNSICGLPGDDDDSNNINNNNDNVDDTRNTPRRNISVVRDVQLMRTSSNDDNTTGGCSDRRVTTPMPYDYDNDNNSERRSTSSFGSAIGVASTTKCIPSTDAIATSHYRSQLEHYRREVSQSGGDAAQINGELNSIFIRRLEDIDCMANGSLELRLLTYQEWVDLLLHINMVVFGNITQMEAETFKRIREGVCKVSDEQREIECDNQKLRKDICALIKIIQNGYHKNCWNFDGINLETITLNQVLGTTNRSSCPSQKPLKPESEGEQMFASLSAEIAKKHDECSKLRAQICALEDKVQTANHKLIFKDEAIACMREKIEELEEQMAPTLFKSMTSCEDPKKPNDMDDIIDDNMLQTLDTELDNLMKMSSVNKFQCFQHHRERLSGIFQTLADQKAEACEKLNNLRCQLKQLEGNRDPCSSVSSGDIDQDRRIIDSIHMRLNCVNESNLEARKRLQKMQIEFQELQSTHEGQKCLYQRTSDVLKEIAELICRLRSEEFNYNDIYCESANVKNPFCVAIMEIYENANRQTEEPNCKSSDTEEDDLQMLQQLKVTTTSDTNTKTAPSYSTTTIAKNSK